MIREILRTVVALVFIASGFVKAVDVKGFSFKLEEYFSPTVFNIPFLENLALPIAVLVVVLELILGFMLLLKLRLKFTLTSLIVLCIFFAFLTFYSAYYNKVTDCGCFGDALKLTPWTSFFKDMLLLLFLFVLYFLYQKRFLIPELNRRKKTLALVSLTVLMALVIVYGILHEPIIDFRDYKEGTNLKIEKQKIAANPDHFETFYMLKNNKTGEEKKVEADIYVGDKLYWEEGSPWEVLTDKTTSELVTKGYDSEIKKFRIEDENGVDVSEQIINLPKVYLVFSYKPDEVSADEIKLAEEKISRMKGKASAYGVSTRKNVFKTLPSLTMDETAMKTIARSNPFVVLLENGKIIRKKSIHDF